MNNRSYNQQYTKDELLAELRRFYEENGRSPIAKELKCSNNMPPLTKYNKEFGTFNNALQLAGLLINKIGDTNKYSKTFLIEELHRFVKENGRVPTTDDMLWRNGYPATKTYMKQFKTFNNALQAAGLKVNNFYNYSPEFLISELRRFYEENGRSPTGDELCNKNGYPSVSVYAKKFGSLNNALRMTGLSVNRFTNYTSELLIEKLKEFYHTYSRSPKASDIDALDTYPSVSVFANVFGSWNNALESAGLDINVVSSYTKEFLISELHRYVKETTMVPLRVDIDAAEGYPSASVYTNAFGSWNASLIEAGLSVNKNSCYNYTINTVCTSCGCRVNKNGNKDENGNFICKTCWTKNWRKNNPKIVKMYNHMHDSTHRGYKTFPINHVFKYSDGHHLWLESDDFVIFIPSFIHQLHHHNHNKPETMLTPNAIAIDYWVNESLYNELYLTGEVYDSTFS